MCNTCIGRRGAAPVFKLNATLKKGIQNPSSRTEVGYAQNEIKIEAEQASALFLNNAKNKIKNKPVKLRKSCDFCWRRKLRCEGGNPCHNCSVRSLVCKHSPRKQRGRHDENSESKPNAQHTESKVSEPDSNSIQVKTEPHETYGFVSNNEYINGERNLQPYSASPYAGLMAPQSSNGLIGAREHSYLTTVLEDFFYVFPMFDSSILQEAWTKVMDGSMSSPAYQGYDAFPFESSEITGESEGIKNREICLSGQLAMRNYQMACAKQAILWGCIATGALLMGCPVETVSKYVFLAESRMKECFDANDEYTADAFMTLGFMNLFLQDHTKYFRYLSFSNNLWTQLPAHRRSNLRFVYMVCGLMSHVYGHADARMKLILASLDEVHDRPTDLTVKEEERLLREIDSIPVKCESELGQRNMTDNRGNDGLGYSSDAIISKPMKDVVRGMIRTFHTSYGTAIYDPSRNNVLSNHENMSQLHETFTAVYDKACTSRASSATFRVIVQSWLMFTKLSLGRYDELLQEAEGILNSVEVLPGLTRAPFNIHKCHASFVVFRLFNQKAHYQRLQRVCNSYYSAEFSIPPFEEISPSTCAMCSSPFCRSVCSDMWQKLGNVNYGAMSSESSNFNTSGYMNELNSDASMTPMILFSQPMVDEFSNDGNFNYGQRASWNGAEAYQYNNSGESIDFNSLLNSFPDDWSETDLQSFEQMDAA